MKGPASQKKQDSYHFIHYSVFFKVFLDESGNSEVICYSAFVSFSMNMGQSPHGSPPQGIIGQPNTAGVIGQQTSAGVIGKSNTGVIGQHNTGGVIGQPSSGVIGQPSTGGVIGQSSNGGIIGQTSSGGVIGQSNTAGVIGQPNTGNNFLSQTQNQTARPHSPMQMSGRSSSAPSQPGQ